MTVTLCVLISPQLKITVEIKMWNPSVYIQTVPEHLCRIAPGSLWKRASFCAFCVKCLEEMVCSAVGRHWCHIQHQHQRSSGEKKRVPGMVQKVSQEHTHVWAAGNNCAVHGFVDSGGCRRPHSDKEDKVHTCSLSTNTLISVPCSPSPRGCVVQGASSTAVKVWHKWCQLQLFEEPAQNRTFVSLLHWSTCHRGFLFLASSLNYLCLSKASNWAEFKKAFLSSCLGGVGGWFFFPSCCLNQSPAFVLAIAWPAPAPCVHCPSPCREEKTLTGKLTSSTWVLDQIGRGKMVLALMEASVIW